MDRPVTIAYRLLIDHVQCEVENGIAYFCNRGEWLCRIGGGGKADRGRA
jgi:hypothetical protein